MQFNTAHAERVPYNSVQPCQRDTDDSSASRGKWWQKNRGNHEFGREEEGKRGERGLKTKGKQGKEGGRERESLGCATVCFIAALTQNRTPLTPNV